MASTDLNIFFCLDTKETKSQEQKYASSPQASSLARIFVLPGAPGILHEI